MVPWEQFKIALIKTSMVFVSSQPLVYSGLRAEEPCRGTPTLSLEKDILRPREAQVLLWLRSQSWRALQKNTNTKFRDRYLEAERSTGTVMNQFLSIQHVWQEQTCKGTTLKCRECPEHISLSITLTNTHTHTRSGSDHSLIKGASLKYTALS